MWQNNINTWIRFNQNRPWEDILVRIIASVCHFLPLAIVMELKFNKAGLGCP